MVKRSKKNKMAVLLSENVIVSEVAKISHMEEIRTPIYLFRTWGPNPIAYISFSTRKFASFGLNKRKKQP